MPQLGKARVPTEAELKRLFGVTRAGNHAKRNAAMLAVSYRLGFRAKEIAGLRVKDVLNITVYLTSTTVAASGTLGVQGRVLRSDGTPASGALLILSFVNGTELWTCGAAADGAYDTNVSLPSRAGKHTLQIAASFAGQNDTTTAILQVQDLPGKTPGFGAAMVIGAVVALILWRGPKGRMAPGRPG